MRWRKRVVLLMKNNNYGVHVLVVADPAVRSQRIADMGVKIANDGYPCFVVTKNYPWPSVERLDSAARMPIIASAISEKNTANVIRKNDISGWARTRFLINFTDVKNGVFCQLLETHRLNYIIFVESEDEVHELRTMIQGHTVH